MLNLKADGKFLNRKRNQKGFTLLEVLVAFSYTAIILLGIYQIHSQTILMEAMNRFNSSAPILAEQKISEVLSDDKDFPTDDEGSFDDPYEGFSWRFRISEIDSEYLGETANRFRKIIVHIESNENEYDLQTYHFFLSGQ